MTLNGAIKQLHELRSAEDMPIYYKPAIAEVINVLLMDTQEVKHGRWLSVKIMDDEAEFGEVDGAQCSVCGCTEHSEYWARTYYHYCPNCGAKMDEVEE